MGIKFAVKQNVDMECYVLEYGSDGYEDIVCLSATDYEDAVMEAQEILDEWFNPAV